MFEAGALGVLDGRPQLRQSSDPGAGGGVVETLPIGSRLSAIRELNNA